MLFLGFLLLIFLRLLLSLLQVALPLFFKGFLVKRKFLSNELTSQWIKISISLKLLCLYQVAFG